MSGPFVLAPPIVVDQPAIEGEDRVAHQPSLNTPGTGLSSDDDHTAVPTPVDSRSIDQNSNEESSSTPKPETKRAKSKLSDSETSSEGQEQGKGWNYGSQLKVCASW